MTLPIALVNLSVVGGGPGATGNGVILGLGGITQFGDDLVVAVVGDAIAAHGPGAHAAATLTTGSPDTFVNGKPLCRIGDEASCGCTVLLGDEDTFCL